MDIDKILRYTDHTALSQTVKASDIEKLVEEGIRYNTASVCVPPCYVAIAKDYAKDAIKVGTVVGFPNGYSTTKCKVYETVNAIANGADEIDMVINLGFVKSKLWDSVASEIKQVKEVCRGKILKVIVETYLLDEEEKIMLCKLVTEAGAAYIKTSTGFAGGGATKADIELILQHIGENVKVKASGGIKTLADAQIYIDLGCTRLGASSIINLVKEHNRGANV